VTAYALPIDTDREWLWLLGLLLIVGSTVAVGLVVTESPGRAAFAVETDGDERAVTVTIERVAGDRSRVAHEGTVTADADGTVVWRTRSASDYRVTVADRATGESCVRGVSVHGRDGEIRVDGPNAPATADPCPVTLRAYPAD
jgi:hypothetical protein